jgi:single-stranded-DNA-specific exonuclease
MQEMGDTAKGSARSFGDFSAVAALEAARDLLISGGGHTAAAGFSLKQPDIAAFRRRLNEYYQSLGLSSQAAYLMTNHDVSITTLSAMNLELWQQLQLMQPFGHGNHEPHFRLERVNIADWRRVGAQKAHIKLDLRDDSGHRLEAIAFRQDADPPPRPSHIIARLDKNEYRGVTTPQAVVDTISR